MMAGANGKNEGGQEIHVCLNVNVRVDTSRILIDNLKWAKPQCLLCRLWLRAIRNNQQTSWTRKDESPCEMDFRESKLLKSPVVVDDACLWMCLNQRHSIATIASLSLF